MVREHSKRSASSKAELCKRFASHFQAEHHRDYAEGSYLCGCLPIETWIDTKHKELHLSMPIPGIKPEAINITLQGKCLTLAGSKRTRGG